MTAGPFAILRVQSLKTWADVDAGTRHGRREDRGTHYDPERTPLNRHWGAVELEAPPDWRDLAEAALARRKAVLRHGAPIAAEFMLAASPEFFVSDSDPDHVDMQRVMEWAEANMALFYRRFGDTVVAARLDLDEGSPHLTVVTVPIYTKKTKRGEQPTVSYRKVFGADKLQDARQKMIELQDWYAAAMAPLGLKRGIPKSVTRRGHLTHHQYARKRRQEDDARLAALQAAERNAAALAAKVKQQEEYLKWAYDRAIEAGMVLGDAEKMKAYLDKAVAAIRAYDPQGAITGALNEREGAFQRADDNLEQLQSTLEDLTTKLPGP